MLEHAPTLTSSIGRRGASVPGCSAAMWTTVKDDEERTEAIGRMAREELEAGLGRGRYAVGAEWDEGSMVHAMRRFGGRTIGWRFGNG